MVSNCIVRNTLVHIASYKVKLKYVFIPDFQCICNGYTTGMSALPDIYTHKREGRRPEDECVYTGKA